MSQLSDFLNTLLLHSHHARQWSQHSVAPSAAWVTITSGTSSYLSSLAANTFCQTVTAVSHLSSASRQLFVVFMVSSLPIMVNWTWCPSLPHSWSCFPFSFGSLSCAHSPAFTFSRIHSVLLFSHSVPFGCTDGLVCP